MIGNPQAVDVERNVKHFTIFDKARVLEFIIVMICKLKQTFIEIKLKYLTF